MSYWLNANELVAQMPEYTTQQRRSSSRMAELLRAQEKQKSPLEALGQNGNDMSDDPAAYLGLNPENM